MLWSIMFLYLELIICIVSVMSLTVFLIIAFSSTGINLQGRIALFAIFLSSLCLNVGHFFKLFTILSKDEFAFDEVYMNNKLFRFSVYCHIFGYYLQSTASMFFTLVQFSTIIFYKRKCISCFIFFVLLILMIGVPITITSLMALREKVIWYANVGFEYVLFFDTFNFITMIGLHKFSVKKYKARLEYDLEHRFQLSQILIWGKSLIPSFMIAKIIRALSVIYILSVIRVDSFFSEEALKVSFSTFNISLDLYDIAIVVGIVVRHKRVRKVLFINSQKQEAPKNIDGMAMSQRETFDAHFARLEIEWNKEPTN